MKKILFVFVCFAFVAILSQCSSSRNTAKAAPALSFEKDILPMFRTSCAPCHFPPDGRKEPLNNYDAVKKNITEVLIRVKLPASDNKYMPFKSKKPALSDSLVRVLEQWQAQNMPQ